MKTALHHKILLSLILSFTLGLLANFETKELEAKPDWFHYLVTSCQFIGTLFLNALKMVVVPLIMTSIICGIAKIGGESNFKRLGLKTFGFYTLSGVLAVTVGLLCVNIFQPGIVDEDIRDKMLQSHQAFDTEKLNSAMDRADNGWVNLLEIFHRMIPTNLFKAGVEGQLLGLIFFSLLFGFFISRLPQKGKQNQTEFWESLNSVILSLTNFIISFAPYGIFGLVTPTLMTVGVDTLSVMGGFALTVLCGLLIHSLIILPLLLRVLGKINFINHLQAMFPGTADRFLYRFFISDPSSYHEVCHPKSWSISKSWKLYITSWSNHEYGWYCSF